MFQLALNDRFFVDLCLGGRVASTDFDRQPVYEIHIFGKASDKHEPSFRQKGDPVY